MPLWNQVIWKLWCCIHICIRLFCTTIIPENFLESLGNWQKLQHSFNMDTGAGNSACFQRLAAWLATIMFNYRLVVLRDSSKMRIFHDLSCELQLFPSKVPVWGWLIDTWGLPTSLGGHWFHHYLPELYDWQANLIAKGSAAFCKKSCMSNK